MIKIAPFKEKRPDKLKSLLYGYKFNDYNNYNIARKDLLDNYIFRRISEWLIKKKEITVAWDRMSAVGLIALDELPWDSEYFGLKMLGVEYLIASGSYARQKEIKMGLVSSAVNRAIEAGSGCIVVKVDTEDFSAIHALESLGFKLMGTHLTFIMDLKRFKIPKLKELYKIRSSKKSDIGQLMRIARVYGPKVSHFSLDQNLSYRKSKDIYAQWVKNSCNGIFCDNVIVAQGDSGIVGFEAYGVNRSLKKTLGINCLHNGLIVVAKQARGAAVLLLKDAAERRAKLKQNIDFIEMDVYNYNYPMIKLCQRIGMSLARTKYIFHGWVEKNKKLRLE
jgi:RimJ/RimL family protein N-acetyltransferase